jgi:tRNA1Val (adenine37-N6)-methyltransferase
MKVCTDACLLGAWTVQKMQELKLQPVHILDIGTGTGLLSLMLAQKTTSVIHAIELNEEAAMQARENFDGSRWAKRLFLYHTSIQQFPVTIKYDWIISNPPFFEDDLQSRDPAKNSAKHHTTLTVAELLSSIQLHLKDDGFSSLLIPWHRTEYLKIIVETHGLFINETLLVKQTPRHGFFRTLLLISKKELPGKTEELSIHDEHRQYTPAFLSLLKDYYLNA